MHLHSLMDKCGHNGALQDSGIFCTCSPIHVELKLKAFHYYQTAHVEKSKDIMERIWFWISVLLKGQFYLLTAWLHRYSMQVKGSQFKWWRFGFQLTVGCSYMVSVEGYTYSQCVYFFNVIIHTHFYIKIICIHNIKNLIFIHAWSTSYKNREITEQ